MENENIEIVEENIPLDPEKNLLENTTTVGEENLGDNPGNNDLPESKETLMEGEVSPDETVNDNISPDSLENIENNIVDESMQQNIINDNGDVSESEFSEEENKQEIESSVSDNKIVSVSNSSDEVNSISGNETIPINVNNIYLMSEEKEETESIVEYTIFDKPFEEYSVSEGFLFLIFLFTMITFIWGLFKRYQ